MGTAVNVLVGASGKIYFGAAGTPMPTTASATLNAAFKDLGHVSEDGVVQAIGTDITEIKAWGGTVVRKIQSSHDVTYKFTLLETNPDALSAYYGKDNVDDTLNDVEIKAGGQQRGEWIIDVVDGDSLVRIRIPDGEVTAWEDITLATAEAISYGVTITTYPDSADVKAYKYFLAPGIS